MIRSAIDTNGAESAPSAPDLATLVAFEDDPVVAGQTIIRGIHIGDLRRAVDAVRSAANLAPAWTNYNAETGVVLASHFVMLRDRLSEALILLQLPAVEVNPSQPVAIGSLIRAEHVRILRGGVQ